MRKKHGVERVNHYLLFSHVCSIQGLSSYEAYQNYPAEVARMQALQDQITGGTTAVVALIFKNKLYVANVGDSRALLCKEADGSWHVEQVTL